MPLVSVCIPAYKDPQALKKALTCLEKQSFKDFEIIITDDSPEDSVENVKNETDLPILYFKNSQALGTPENWNESIRKASGEFILLHHHDDWLSQPESLEKLVKPLLENPKAGFSFGMVNILDNRSGKVLYRNMLDPTKRNILKTQPEQLTIGNFIGPPTSILFRHEKKLWFDNKIKWLVDTDFFIRLIRSSETFEYIPEPLVSIGIHENQVTKSVLKDKDLLLFEYFYEAEKFGLDLTKQPFLDGYGNWLMKLNVKSYKEIEKFNFQTDFSGAVDKMLKRKNLYRFREYYVKSVMYWKYEVLKLKRNIPNNEL